MPSLFMFLATSMGRWIALIAGVAVLVVSWRVSDIAKQRAIGETRAVAKVTEATKHVAKKANTAAARSADGRVRGTIDPSTRND
jgi:Zn-dependent protease with chaperone function